MIGILLYEIVDIVFYTGKLGVNGVYGIYKWYTGKNNQNNTGANECKIDMKIIEQMERRIKMLEEIIENNKEK